MILKFKSQLNMAVVNNYGPVPLIHVNAVALKVKGVALHTCACPVLSISFRIAIKLTKLGSKLIIFLNTFE